MRQLSNAFRLKLLTGRWTGEYAGEGSRPPRREKVDALWERHRRELMEDHILLSPGTRPWAFWQIDHRMRPPKNQAEWLEQHGLLSEIERTVILETV